MNVSGETPQSCLNIPTICPLTTSAFSAPTIGANLPSVLSSCCQNLVLWYDVVSGIPCFRYCNLTKGSDFNAVQQRIVSTPGLQADIITKCGPAESASAPSLVRGGNMLGIILDLSLVANCLLTELNELVFRSMVRYCSSCSPQYSRLLRTSLLDI
jgi:hypothetical protein